MFFVPLEFIKSQDTPLGNIFSSSVEYWLSITFKYLMTFV